MFDLNLLLRHGLEYNPVNADNLLMYIKQKQYQDVFNFELGNGMDLHASYFSVYSLVFMLLFLNMETCYNANILFYPGCPSAAV